MLSTLNTRINKKGRRHGRFYCQICIAISLINVVLTIFIVNLIISIGLPGKSTASEVKTIYTSETDLILSDVQDPATRYIYIDIGCFNGETVEHFLHFTPNSNIYEIITFEPDPQNYQLCKQRLIQTKYKNINITILQKVVWIRDEKVFFRTNRGKHSRITSNKTAVKHHSTQLDAIDFSSWLARLAKANKIKIYIKMNIPGAELAVLEKMIRDETLELVDKYEIEWSDKSNFRHSSLRIYLQLMFDNRGFDCLYYTCLQDARDIFKINGTFNNIKKYYDVKLINASSNTYGHYKQRIEVIGPIHKLK